MKHLLLILSALILSACQTTTSNRQYTPQPNYNGDYSYHSPVSNQQSELQLLLNKLNVELETDEYQQLQHWVDLEYQQLKKNNFVARSLKRGNKYIPYILQELRQANLPPEFAYLALIESGFKPSAKSHKGAKGVWQFMPRTAKGLGLSPYHRDDVVKSTQAAIRYLKKRYGVFGDDSLLVAASYNVGEGGISSRLRRLKDPFKRSFVSIYPQLPTETKNYVPRWLAATLIVDELRESALHQQPEVIIIVNKRYLIESLLKQLEVSADEFNQLNPQYKRQRYLNKRNNFIVFEQVNAQAEFDGLMLQANDNYIVRAIKEDRASPLAYYQPRKASAKKQRRSNAKFIKIKIQQGMTYSHLKDWFGVSKSQLRRYNPSLKRGLFAGSIIKVPAPKKKARYYRVKKGDTLGKIAQKQRISLSKLRLTNGVRRNQIYVGQKLILL
ncbi:transglycosylase SLT domain-containing protein [Psychrobium sp. nBUS_13]|uniref:lytic transglycosylase domain-containing protein n=1 Tax=Psychrobium sp. nBUS_13 TaxID=3395319 RepID=UPI003EBC2B9E